MENETTHKILAGAKELFFRHGIKSITMDDIAKHLGMSKKTIYQYFKDKNEVVHMLMKHTLASDQRDIECIKKESNNVIEEVMEMMKHMTKMFSSINPNLFYDIQKYHPQSWKLLDDFKKKCVEKMVEDSIEKGKKQGLVRVDVDSKVLSRLRIHEIEMAFNMDLFPPDQFQTLQVQLALTDHFLHGIYTIKGHKLINKYKEIIEEE
ncbi:MAG: TetR/AcrR family transcriptional regulator [Bacteroidetes bacterium]|nr:TetR/AcrR family transcriptional regulator [Bacteroidota bacterium]